MERKGRTDATEDVRRWWR